MEQSEFRRIPFYENYGVSRAGDVISFEREMVLSQYLLNGYFVVNTFRGSLTETLPVHRAVALAWVKNPSPELFTIVNHKDTNVLNNWFENLEWTNHSGNNYHAIENGLRPDNIPCKVRDFLTGEVNSFSSMAQASEYMGLSKDTHIEHLRFKKFGRLVQDRYEFRFETDPEPWFYENRTKRIRPARYMVSVREPNGIVKEFFSYIDLLKEYQLYRSPSKSMPELVEFGRSVFPDKEFTIRDGFSEPRFKVERHVKRSIVQPVRAKKGGTEMNFSSLTRCAKYFKVDRFSILTRISNGKDLNGWTFTQLSL